MFFHRNCIISRAWVLRPRYRSSQASCSLSHSSHYLSRKRKKMNENSLTHTLHSTYSLAKDFSPFELQAPSCFWDSLGVESTVDIINTLKYTSWSQKCLRKRKPSSTAGIMGSGLEAAHTLCRHISEFPERGKQCQHFFMVTIFPWAKERQPWAEIHSFASLPFPSAVVSAIRVSATNSLPACNLLFPICHLRNQMTRAVRPMCKLRAKLWEIARDPLLQESM